MDGSGVCPASLLMASPPQLPHSASSAPMAALIFRQQIQLDACASDTLCAGVGSNIPTADYPQPHESVCGLGQFRQNNNFGRNFGRFIFIAFFDLSELICIRNSGSPIWYARPINRCRQQSFELIENKVRGGFFPCQWPEHLFGVPVELWSGKKIGRHSIEIVETDTSRGGNVKKSLTILRISVVFPDDVSRRWRILNESHRISEKFFLLLGK